MAETKSNNSLVEQLVGEKHRISLDSHNENAMHGNANAAYNTYTHYANNFELNNYDTNDCRWGFFLLVCSFVLRLFLIFFISNGF